MTASKHLLSSLPLGCVYYAVTRSIWASVLVVISAVAVDVDHILDYVITQKRIAPIRTMMRAFESFELIHKNYFILHSWELVILSLALICRFPDKYLVAAFIGYAAHIVSDQIFNSKCLGRYNVRKGFYFFLYRRAKGFDVMSLRKSDDIGGDARIYG